MNTSAFISQNNKWMTYKNRISLSLLFSLIIHICLLFFLARLPYSPLVSTYVPENKPITIQFVRPEQQKSIKKLVEVTEPSDEKPSNTDNIAEFNSISSGPQKTEGDTPGPPLPEQSKIETLGSESKKMQMATVIPSERKPPRVPVKEKNTQGKQSLIKSPPITEQKTPVIQQPEEKIRNEPVEENKKPEESWKPENTENPFTKPQGRIYNQVKREGILGFEALQDQIAPYLREIQKKVEKYWLHYLLTRYSGTKPTEVVIDCEINSEGKIVKIEIVGKPEDPLFAGICKQALQVSAPFSPFPFQVPDIYQNKNLQIRWTFNFL